jgi:hypothetical protein
MPLTREQEIKAALKAARLPSRDRNLFRDLFEKADWGTALLPNRFQPRNIDELARIAGVSARTAQRSLDHLVLHGWITKGPRTAPGRHGRAITYGFQPGEDCRCKPDRAEPLTAAERARRYRERKQRQIGVTPEGISRQECVTYNATESDGFAGQNARRAEEGRDEGNGGGKPRRNAEGDYMGGPVVWDWPAGSYGEEANR